MANHAFDAITTPGLDGAPFLDVPAGETLTYAEMRGRVAGMAAALIALGVVPGDRVAAQIEKSAAGVIVYLATVRAGAVFLPLNTAYTTAELAYFLTDAEPKVVICDPARRTAIAAVAGPSTYVETLDAEGRGSICDKAEGAEGVDVVARAPDDLAAILYTSGTTGRPKGAMLTHANLTSNARTLVDVWRVTSDDRLLHALPIYHTHGLFVACNATLVAGASMIFMPKFDEDAMIAAMPHASVMMGVPTFYTRLLDRTDFDRDVAAGMRLFISGSAPLLADTHRAWFARTGHAILERYGMTETNMNCSNPYDRERRPGTVGFPLPGVSVRIADPETGGAVRRESVGMIEVEGPNVFKGYWRDPDRTKTEFRDDGFFITGDLGKIDGDGYVHIVGRRKDIVICGGLNVYPKEVEIAIDAIDGVLESAVIGLPHHDFGEAVAAVVVTRGGAALDECGIHTALRERLARFKQPRRVLFVPALPRNAMGKVQKNLLRETFADTFADLGTGSE